MIRHDLEAPKIARSAAGCKRLLRLYTMRDGEADADREIIGGGGQVMFEAISIEERRDAGSSTTTDDADRHG